MSPNLEKLFQEAKEEQGVILWNKPHLERRNRLLATHGRALIEALEQAQDIIHEEWCADYLHASNERLYRHHPKCEGIVRLLTTLERDAKGPQ